MKSNRLVGDWEYFSESELRDLQNQLGEMFKSNLDLAAEKLTWDDTHQECDAYCLAIGDAHHHGMKNLTYSGTVPEEQSGNVRPTKQCPYRNEDCPKCITKPVSINKETLDSMRASITENEILLQKPMIEKLNVVEQSFYAGQEVVEKLNEVIDRLNTL